MKIIDSIRMVARIHREIGIGHIGAIVIELGEAALAFSMANPQRCGNPHCRSTRCRLVNAAHGWRGLVTAYMPGAAVVVAAQYTSIDTLAADVTSHPEHGAN